MATFLLIPFRLLLVGVCFAACLGENLSTGVDVDSYVEKLIHSNDVMVFAKSYCPYCRHTRQLLQVRTLAVARIHRGSAPGVA
jgi:Glutaredoxin